MAQLDISDENLMKLKRIRRAILEDGIESNLGEALARVLDFYRKFVPCN